MPTLVLLIRHALTDTAGKKLTGWDPGVHLNERGREQAERLAERLGPLPIRAIYASTLERCVETATPLARAKGLDVRTIDTLRDVHYGAWTGRNIAPLRKTKLWSKLVASPGDARFPHGETLRETQARVVAEVASLVDRHPRQLIAVCSHADPIKLVLAHYLGQHIDLFNRLVVAPASVSAVAVTSGAPHVLRINDTGTLADLVPPRPKRAR
jgi:probable phosphomutase (TIGR03848 family)